MKKLLSGLLVLLLIAGCSSAQSSESEESSSETSEIVQEEINQLSVLCPSGAPSFAFAKELQSNDTIEIVDGTDLLQAAFVNQEYDVIVAPSNFGAALASKGASDYKMVAVLTWGNLYVIGTDEDALASGEMAAFGDGAVPGKVWETVKEALDIEFHEEYYNSAADVQAALISGNFNVGLIAEPAATATITKAAQSGIELSFLLDLQELWQQVTGNEGGYPQAAIFVLEDKYNEDKASYDALFDNISAYIEETAASDKSQLIADVDAVGAETFGIAQSAVVAKTWDTMNIRFAYAKDHKENLLNFLQVFGIESLDNLIIE